MPPVSCQQHNLGQAGRIQASDATDSSRRRPIVTARGNCCGEKVSRRKARAMKYSNVNICSPQEWLFTTCQLSLVHYFHHAHCVFGHALRLGAICWYHCLIAKGTPASTQVTSLCILLICLLGVRESPLLLSPLSFAPLHLLWARHD